MKKIYEDGINKDDPNGSPIDSLDLETDVPAEDYTPEGFESQEKFLSYVREEYAADVEADKHNREEAITDKKFAAGEQWDPQVLEHRKGLPNLVINTVPQFTAQLVGDWRSSRNAVKVVPAEDGDVEVASIRGDLIRAIEMKSRAQRVYDDAFESTIQCGDGAFRVKVGYLRDDVFDQEIGLEPIADCHSVVWDRLSIDPTGRDARHVFVDDALPQKEFNRRWPDHDPSVLNTDQKHDLSFEGWFEGDTVRVTEYWRMIERDRLLIMFEDGKVFAADDIKDMEEVVIMHGSPVRSRVAKCMYAQMHLISGHAILSGPYEYKINRVPIIRMSGRTVNVGQRRIRYGLVRFMKDAARLRNFWRSKAAEQLGYAANAVWMGPASAFEGREDKWRKAHLSRDPVLIYNDGAEAPPQQISPPTPEVALHNEAQVNAQDMKDITGIHDASLGIRSNEVSGKAIHARQREGDIASLTYYDNGNAAILEAGDVMNQLIPQIYDATRIIRIIGEDEEPKLLKINDPSDPTIPDLSVGHYDVALSTGPSFTTRRVEAAEAMMQAIQVAPDLMGVAGDLIIKAQDWPDADKLAERLKRAMPPHLTQDEDGEPIIPPQVQQAMQELQAAVETLQAEKSELETDKTIDMLKVKVDEYNAITQRIRALSDHEVDNNKIGMDAMKALLADVPNEPQTQSPTQ